MSFPCTASAPPPPLDAAGNRCFVRPVRRAPFGHVVDEYEGDVVERERVWLTRLEFQVTQPWADLGTFQFGESPCHFGIELAVTPWDELHWEGPEASRRSRLYPGKIIGFRLRMFDVDEGSRGPVVSHHHSLPAYRDFDSMLASAFDASFFADGELIPCDLPGCSGATAVEVDSWGRIKASFR